MQRVVVLAAGLALAGGVTATSGYGEDTPGPPGSIGYDPYPAGIVPADLNSEIERVRREVRAIFDQTLAQSRNLPPLKVSGNPPVIEGGGYGALQILGKLMNFDENMSVFRNQACGSCHMPYVGYSGPIPSVNMTMIGYPGTVHSRAGKRTAQRYTYAPAFPVLHDVHGAFFGGNFWDANSTGYLLQNPAAEQALHPPVGPVELGFPDGACIAYRLSQAVYRPLFEKIWGAEFDIHWPPDTERICGTPGGATALGSTATPIPLNAADRAKANDIYDHWGQTVSFLERSPIVSAFSSKFDAFLAGSYTLTKDESDGYDLFRGKANCNSCHLDGRSTGLAKGQSDTGAASDTTPLFTCFGYANIGLPLNPRGAFLYESKPDPVGYTPNPYGFGYRDLGLGAFLRSSFGTNPNPNSEWLQFATASDGQMQTSSARNVAMTPKQCPTTEAGQTDANGHPVPYFQKEFFHNGYAKSLKQLVHFYNTRDLYKLNVTSGHCPAGKTEKVDCWPMPEVPNNIDMTLGNLGLTDHEEELLVTFLQTLTDGFTTPYPFIDAFTGTCGTGGSAATQGNDLLVATPSLPSCASDVCGVAPLPGPTAIQ